MAYTPKTLSAWVLENPNYNAFAGTASGKPLIYQSAANSAALSKSAEDWFVWDYISEFPDLATSPATADISTTGSLARKLVSIVADAPSASDLEIFLGTDTDGTLDAIDGIVEVYATAVTAQEKFFLGTFMGIDKRSEVYEASIAKSGGTTGSFPDPITKNLSVTPNLGSFYDDNFVITNI